jgi:hypothetical protein
MHRNRDGEPLIRTRAIIMKASGLVLVCHQCRGDVPISADIFVKAQPFIVLQKANRL